MKNGIWIPIIASVGVGAATFYTMTKNNQTVGQAVQKMIPFVSQMGGDSGQSGAGQLGPHGMS
ncbi:hypothetical protein KQI49_17475 [Virgibacillus sp. MSJ-26]|uniref:hypothetical protein n=1 Tax=Virgibacillus sp. MSJ-26 TaxID=2841522 RepID=UPI001C0FD912|nr:hypothetical protein [Virgibacillus sp. MSJ-26]MBU5468602.1 hypothetical protein [Virgibacillus sp. MSJ-26]